MFCFIENVKNIEIIISCKNRARTKEKFKNFNRPFNLKSFAEYKNNMNGAE